MRTWDNNIEKIEDALVRSNFDQLREALNACPMLLFEGKHTELWFDGTYSYPITNLKIPHGLSFVPSDVIQTSRTGSGTVTFNYSRFSSTHIDVSVDAQVRIRVLIGRFAAEG